LSLINLDILSTISGIKAIALSTAEDVFETCKILTLSFLHIKNATGVIVTPAPAPPPNAKAVTLARYAGNIKYIAYADKFITLTTLESIVYLQFKTR